MSRAISSRHQSRKKLKSNAIFGQSLEKFREFFHRKKKNEITLLIAGTIQSHPSVHPSIVMENEFGARSRWVNHIYATKTKR